MSAERTHILFVEDDEVDQLAIRRMAKRESFQHAITVVATVAQAEEALRSATFDAIIADYNLGDGTAMDVLAVAGQTPVIIATGAGDEKIAREAMKAGAFDYLIKDHSHSHLEVLPMVIQKAIEHAATQRQLEAYHHELERLVQERTEQLAREKELIAVTLASLSDGIIAVDPDKRIILFNAVAGHMTGWPPQEAIGQPLESVLQVVDEKHRRPVASCVDTVMEQGHPAAGGADDVLVSRGGTDHPVALNAAPIRKDDRTLGVVVVVRDVTHQREIDRMKTDFVSSVSHELRTPLTSIKAFTATILRDPNMPDETRNQFLHIIDEESNRLGNLIEDLLQISRIESGRLTLEMQTVSIDQVLSQVIPPLEPLAAKKDITLECQIGENLPPIEVDPQKLQSVFTNLVNNAIKFTPEGGRVTISVEAQEDTLLCRVTDTGLGIPEDDLEKIFERFHRVNRPGKEIQGTGLGLAIVKNIVELHHGSIQVESQVDAGTTFTVALPATQATVVTA
ncbi:MAG TPA: PAS domain-containing protein [Phycisphaerales bacterium]|nr:PAS domain-containing protein [Phycisphaerales bacterium]